MKVKTVTVRALVALFITATLVWGALDLGLAAEKSKQEVKPKYGGTLRREFEGDVPSLDPAHIGDTQSHEVGYCIYNGLLGYANDSAELVPELATSYTVSPDRKTYTFKLRKGVKFHNGREFEASDVKYSLERIIDPKTKSEGQWTMEGILGAKEFAEGKAKEVVGIKVIDKYTVSITLAKPLPFFPSIMAMSYAYIVPKEEVEKWGEDFTRHPCGTGPFKFAEWKAGQYVKVVRNPEYWEKDKWGQRLPYLDAIIWYFIPDENVRFMKFENGELDLYYRIPPASFERIMKDRKRAPYVVRGPQMVIQYFGMNNSRPPFNNVLVRRAFNHAVNKVKIIQKVINGRGIMAQGVLPPGFPGYNPNLRSGYPNKAKALLAEAGYGPNNPFPKITIWYNQHGTWQKVAESIQADLKAIGVDAELQSAQWSTYLDKVRRYDLDIFRLGWMADYPDPDNFLWTLFHSDNIGQDNSAAYKNPEVDKLLDAARVERDWKKRVELYQKAEKLIVADAPWIFLYHPITDWIHQPYVHGVIVHPIVQQVYKVIWMDKK